MARSNSVSRAASADLYFSVCLRHYFHGRMNQDFHNGVLPMYQVSGHAVAGPEIRESARRADAAQVKHTVQEWILSHPGAEPEAAVRAGEPRAASAMASNQEWEVLLAENAPLAFRVARGVLRNDGDAEDVAQEALLRAYQKLSRLRERVSFRAWLVRITFRLALDRLRSMKRRQLRESQWVFENARQERHSGENPEFQRQFDRALEELPEKQRLALLLAAMEGHSLEEVSRLLAVPVGTVKSRLFAARKAMAEKLRCFVQRTSGN